MRIFRQQGVGQFLDVRAPGWMLAASCNIWPVGFHTLRIKTNLLGRRIRPPDPQHNQISQKINPWHDSAPGLRAFVLKAPKSPFHNSTPFPESRTLRPRNRDVTCEAPQPVTAVRVTLLNWSNQKQAEFTKPSGQGNAKQNAAAPTLHIAALVVLPSAVGKYPANFASCPYSQRKFAARRTVTAVTGLPLARGRGGNISEPGLFVASDHRLFVTARGD